ncbi:MAG: hypothetical protein FWD60_11955 [Candidatus Azobacteroides sp.]|nr:hypothetical protein [Candidatus Azobacteroides sp.]
METIGTEKRRKVDVIPISNNIITEKKSANTEDFFKGTISGEELVKYVCDRLDEKYGKR